MTKIDKMVSVLVLGTIAPVMSMLLFWWGSIPFLKEEKLIAFLALTGLLLGLILDVTLLRGFVLSLFDLSLTALAAVAVFYSVMIYGFFMGLPVFNSMVGIAGSCIVARKCMLLNMTREDAAKNIRCIIRVSTVILTVLCIITAVLALRESTICAQLKGMLHLPFDVTMEMVWGLILIGGSALLLFQYHISKLVAAGAVRSL